MRKLLLVGALLIASLAPVKAQSGLRQIPLGFCSLSSMSSATLLSTCPIPAGTTYAVLCAYAQGVVYRDDGGVPTTTPGTGGQGLAAGQCIPYNGNFTAVQVIQQAGGAILGVSFYK